MGGTVKTSRNIITLALAAALAGGCGLGIHINPTAAVTAPYHDHQSKIQDFPSVRPQNRTIAAPMVSVGTFARYYPEPIGFMLGVGRGAMRSWGRGKTVTWAAVEISTPPEQAVQAAFARGLGGGAPADPQLVVSGVVTDVSWYWIKAMKGGRITTRVVVARKDGTPVFEGERSTTGRANDLDELIAAHVDGWLTDPQLAAALTSGGAK
jgi:hypothetical protein